jgi:hypothetical protein
MFDLNNEDALLGEQWEPPDDPPQCELCWELMDTDRAGFVTDAGEFVNADGEHVYAHAQCGLSAGLELA